MCGCVLRASFLILKRWWWWWRKHNQPSPDWQNSVLVDNWRRLIDWLGQSRPGVRSRSFLCVRCENVARATGLLPRFYRSMLCIRGTSHGPVSVRLSVCPSVTSRSSTKTAKRRITQTTRHDRPGTLVYWCQRSPRNLTGVTPYEGAECRCGGSKSATFDK